LASNTDGSREPILSAEDLRDETSAGAASTCSAGAAY